MLSRFILVGLASALLIGCRQQPASSDAKHPASARSSTSLGEGPLAARFLKVDEDLLLGPPVVHRNLAIFPVASQQPQSDDRFITLDEGLKTGEVEVLEASAARGAPSALPAERSADENAAGQVGGYASRNSPPGDSQDDPFAPSEAGSAEVAGEEGERQPSSEQAATQAADPFASDPFAAPPGPDPFAANVVNRVFVVNKSNRPLYLMPGEIIMGGDQDRTISQELVIQPTGKPTPVEVFCVEQGRWGGRGADNVALLQNAQAFPTNLSLVVSQSQSIEEAAEQADRGKFIATPGSLSKAARLTVQDAKNQSKVWEAVASENAKSDVEAETGAYSGQYVQEEAVRRLQPYVDTLQQPVAEREQIVGVVVAIDGEVEMLDIFATTPLFRKLWPKLLKSYAVDAANAAGSAEANSSAIASRKAAREFLLEALQSEVEHAEVNEGIALTKRSSESIVTFSASEDQAASGMGGGFGGSVHASGFAR